MNIRVVLNVISKMLALESLMMAPSLAVSLMYREGDAPAFLAAMLLLLLVGLPLMLRVNPGASDVGPREGLVSVALSWVFLSVFGALPFMFTGDIPAFWDALFETVSGFTTTGASILPAVEGLGHGLLFWRSFTHWVGGMGVLLLTLAIMPRIHGGGSALAQAESPGPTFSKVTPRMTDTARLMYLVYTAMTLAQVLLLLVSGLPLFDSLIHAFGSAGTGGFSSRNLSVGAYNNVWAEVIITVFMLLFGTNFSVYVRLFRGEGWKAFKSEEVRAYYVLAVLAMLVITLNITPHHGGFFPALRHASFQVSTIMSTTGFASTDFDLWPAFSHGVLIILMLIGACAGSTAGGIKVVRVVLLTKAAARDVGHNVQPRKVRLLTLDGKTVGEEVLRGVFVFFFVYIALLMMGTLLLMLDGYDFVTCFTATASCLSNIGPGLRLVGPMGNFGLFSPANKYMLSFLMLAGRLEFIPLFALFHPAVWRRGR